MARCHHERIGRARACRVTARRWIRFVCYGRQPRQRLNDMCGGPSHPLNARRFKKFLKRNFPGLRSLRFDGPMVRPHFGK